MSLKIIEKKQELDKQLADQTIKAKTDEVMWIRGKVDEINNEFKKLDGMES
jgi:hypothetical protein